MVPATGLEGLRQIVENLNIFAGISHGCLFSAFWAVPFSFPPVVPDDFGEFIFHFVGSNSGNRPRNPRPGTSRTFFRVQKIKSKESGINSKALLRLAFLACAKSKMKLAKFIKLLPFPFSISNSSIHRFVFRPRREYLHGRKDRILGR